MILTEDLIRAGMTKGFGINKKQAKILHVDVTKSGWLKNLIGTEISEETYNAFLLLKGISNKEKPVIFSIKEVATKIGTSYDVVKNATKRCYPEAVKNGKKTELTPGMVTVIIEDIKGNNKTTEQLTFEAASKVSKASTLLTPALKIKKAMELMQEGYEEELANLRAKNVELEAFKIETEAKLIKGDLVETPSENLRNHLTQNLKHLGKVRGGKNYGKTTAEFYRRIERDLSINLYTRAKAKGVKPIDIICSLPIETFNKIFAISVKMIKECGAEPVYESDIA